MKILCRIAHRWRWHDIPEDGVWRHKCKRCDAEKRQQLEGWS